MSEPHALLMWFDQEHRRCRESWPAPIVRGRDHKLAAMCLETYSMEQMKVLVSHFFEVGDEWIDHAGYGFNIFKSCLPKVLSSYQRKKRADVIANQQREQRERRLAETPVVNVSMDEWRRMSQADRDRLLHPPKKVG